MTSSVKLIRKPFLSHFLLHIIMILLISLFSFSGNIFTVHCILLDVVIGCSGWVVDSHSGFS